MTALQPFQGGDARATFQNILDDVHREIEGLDNQYVLKAAPSELEEFYVTKGTIDPLRLHTEQKAIESQRGVEIDVSRDFRYVAARRGHEAHVRGTLLEIAIPFEGDPVLWKLRPSRYRMARYLELYVHHDRIVFHVQYPDAGADGVQVRQEIDDFVQLLAESVETLRRDAEQHNSFVSEHVRSWLAAKRLKAENAVGVLGVLGLPVKPRDVPTCLRVSLKRKQIVLSRPRVASEPFRPEPTLDDAIHEEILKSLHAMSLVIERNPQSFQRLDEEAIRDHFLINLNSLFEGQATGETFNRAGKTDILIRAEDRNVFIGECKFWTGQAAFSEAIDQLLSYLTWRDCKCALLVFNRNKDSGAVLNKMHEVISQRKEHRKTVWNKQDEGGRYVLVKDSEPGREIVVTTLLFDVPTSK